MSIPSGDETALAMADRLVAVAATRDIAAFEILFRHFAPRVSVYMARIVGDAAAEELMQETMVAVWKKAGQFDAARGSASAWIFTIARNLRIDAHRRGQRPGFDPHDPAFVPDAAPTADAALGARQSSESLRAALKTLPEEQRAMLTLAFFDDKSHSAIARELNIPLGTVKSRLRLAFAKLRIALEGEGAPP